MSRLFRKQNPLNPVIHIESIFYTYWLQKGEKALWTNQEKVAEHPKTTRVILSTKPKTVDHAYPLC
jgi:hypothetical protein